MIYEQFVKKIEAYYGQYPGPPRDVRKAVMTYLRGRFKESELESLLRAVTMTFSGEYKAVPDIAVFERAKVAEIHRPTKRGNYVPLPGVEMTDADKQEMIRNLRALISELAEKKRA